MKKFMTKFFKTLLLLAPLLCGMAGFVILDRQPFLDSLFQCVIMYALNFGDTPPNFLVEIARWTAPLATASGIIMAFVSLKESVKNGLKYLHGSSVAVYGPERDKAEMLSQLGRNGIDGRDRFVKAQRYILLDGEEQNLAFYREHADFLKDCMVYLKCRSLQAQAVSEASLKLFCPEETAARLFWKRRCLYTASGEAGRQLRIVLLGFGKLGEELLFWGLQDNIFSPGQRIEYHVFGDCNAFLATHRELKQIGDPVICHPEAWYDALELIGQADMVAVLEQENQLALLRDLLFSTSRQEFDVFSPESGAAELLEGSGRLRLFDWEKEARKLENIFDEILYERAKRINLRYCSIYGGVEENAGNMELEWKRLDAFTRYSNISSADYHEVRLAMLEAMGLPADPGALPPDKLELLSELEHIRWCRYHYLNNWRYGRPDNGKSKDPARRIHADLVEYSTLTEEEKEKDRENIRILLSV